MAPSLEPEKTMPGITETAADWAPWHCGGGPGVNSFDSIGALEQWVEQGQAPDTMMGTGAEGLTRPLCPYPQFAEYDGAGDLKDASNWACTVPASR